LNKFIAWMAGCFICLGYLIHLSLDEIYSVDLRGIRIKKSFGTALKPVSLRYLKATIALLLLTVLVFYTTPKADFFVQRVLNAGTYLQIKEHLLPKARWFKIYDQLG
jgi:hypothetical protein